MELPYKRAVIGVVLATALLGAVPATVFAANPACGTTIMTNRTLTSDLDCSGYAGDAIIFGKKGLTFNLNGYTLWGPVGDDSYTGVYTNSKKNVTVRNGTIADYDIGVYVYQTVGGTVKGLTIDGSGADTNDIGVYVYYGADNTVHNNNINDQAYGVDIEYSAGNWVTNNDVTDTYEDAFYGSYNHGNHFSGNTATNYDSAGFYNYETSADVYTGNRADAGSWSGNYGFYFECDEYGWVTARNNWTTGNDSYGFYVYECYDYYAYNNFQSTVIDGNVSNDNDGDGFYDYYSLQAIYTNNTAKRNDGDGFYMDYPGGIVFNGNVANRNTDDGIQFDDMGYGFYSNPKLVKNNTANRNDSYGIYAQFGIGGATGNVALNNGTAPDNCYNIACN